MLQFLHKHTISAVFKTNQSIDTSLAASIKNLGPSGNRKYIQYPQCSVSLQARKLLVSVK